MQDVQSIIPNPAIPPPSADAPVEHELLGVIRKLPPDSELILNGQTWADYNRLLDALLEPPGIRVAFDGESLQVARSSVAHQKYVRLFENVIHTASMALEIDIESIGSATIKQSLIERGLEPDGSYYIQNIEVAAGRMEIDFEVEPMPDLAVEIDVYNTTLNKLPIYAALGFPEVWRFQAERFQFFKLEQGKYVPIEKSLAFPILTPDVLAKFLNRAQGDKQNAILRDFESWLQNHID